MIWPLAPCLRHAVGRSVLCTLGFFRDLDVVAPEDSTLQFPLAGIGHFSGGLLRNRVWFTKGDAPFQKQPQPGLHGMGSCFHDYEMSLGNRFQLVSGHKGALDHLEGLAGIILALADGTGHDGAAAQGLGQHLSGLAVGGESAEDRILHVVLDDLSALLAVVLFKLRQGLDDGYQGQPA